MTIIGLDIGKHSLKYAVLSKGDKSPVLHEIPTYILINPTNHKVLHAGQEALDNYLERGVDIPANVELMSDFINPDDIKPLLEKIDEVTRKKTRGVAVTFSVEALKNVESVDAVLDVISDCFTQDTQLVALNEALCIAANYGSQKYDANLIICDFGKSALKISACSFVDGAYQLKKSETNTKLGWSELENKFLNFFDAYKTSRNDPHKQLFRRDLLNLWFDSKTHQLYSLMFKKGFDVLEKDGGLYGQPFLSMGYGSSRQDLPLLKAHEFYKDFASDIIKALKEFLSSFNDDFSVAPILITGAGACTFDFGNFLNAIGENDNLPNRCVVADNPKFFVAESASKIANNHVNYFPSSNFKIAFEYKQLKHGESVDSRIEISPTDRVFGESEALQIFTIKSRSSAPNLSYGDFVFTIDQEIEEGEYKLYQSKDRHGELMLHLQKYDQEKSLKYSYERRKQGELPS